jgi:hypothetical protein
MINSIFTLESTSKQGALSGTRVSRSVVYNIQLTMKEGKWEQIKPVVFNFYAAASAFLFGEPRWNYVRNLRETKRDCTPYNSWKKINVQIRHEFNNDADAERFIEELKSE